jgi:hypothetical protein
MAIPVTGGIASIFRPLEIKISREARAAVVRSNRAEAAAFGKDLHKWAKAVPDQVILQHTQRLAMLALRSLVKSTPVDTGRARGAWLVSLTSPAGQGSKAKSKEGEGTIKKGSSTVLAAKPYQIIWISNNTSYIRILDEGGFVPANPGPSKTGGSQSKRGRKHRKGEVLVKDGYSMQAPRGMMAVTLEKLRAYKLP